jgi:hypothetical protein
MVISLRRTPEPAQTRALDGRCPVCGKPVTVGVLHRVEELADRPVGVRPEGAPGFANFLQLPQIIGELHRVGPRSKKVVSEIAGLTALFGPELEILQSVPLDEVAVRSRMLATALERLRSGRVVTEPGYDGEYGVIRVFEDGEAADDGLFELTDVAASPAKAVVPRRTKHLAVTPTMLPDGGGVTGLSGLDADQRAAVAHGSGPLLIVAGPGTGKTRTLTHRIAHLVTARGVRPEARLAITFTRRAADEMRSACGHCCRTASRESPLPPSTPSACGFSASSTSEPAPPDFQVEDDGEIGFDDLIRLPVELLESDQELAATYRGRYQWISVDEYQDVDEWQYRLPQLAPPDGNLCAIGDPDQAIYGFRGADVGFFLRFQDRLPGSPRRPAHP